MGAADVGVALFGKIMGKLAVKKEISHAHVRVAGEGVVRQHSVVRLYLFGVVGRFGIKTRRRLHLNIDHPVVFTMRPNPNPNEIVLIFNRQCSISYSYTNRSEFANFLEMQ